MKRLLVLMAAGLLLAGCGKDEEPPEPVRPVLFVTVQPQSEQSLGRFAGTIEARYQSTLGFRIAGRIAQRNVDVGSEVAAGQLLAVLDPTDQQNRVRASQGDVARIEAQHINAEADARRQQELFDRGVGAQAQLDIALTNLRTARSSLDQAKASEQQARDQLSYSELRSDHAAVITQWSAEAGQTVSAGEQVVTLARPDIKEAVIDLPSALAENLPADVVFDVASQLEPNVTTTATVRELEPQAERTTRTRRARLTLANTPAAFRLGTAISVSAHSTIEPRIQLPENALQTRDGKTRIWVIDEQNQTVSPREVKVIEHADGAIVLAGGVKAGEKVVVAGVNSLKPGQKVKTDGSRRG